MQLIRQGATAGRVELTGRRGHGAGRRSRSASAPPSRSAPASTAPCCAPPSSSAASSPTLVFTPDRLVVVKGGPAARRAYIDRSLGRLYPARAHVSLDYAAAVGQRNAALRRVALGVSERDVLAPWTAQVADLGAMLDCRPARRDRAAAAELRRARRRARPRGRLARLRRRAPDDHRSSRSASPATSSGGRPASARTWTRSRSSSGDRDLRTFGSQGEQRLAVLALLLAEAELIGERRRVPPLLLLDDALSELDESRRRTLSERIGAMGQTIVTATGSEALPLAPAQLLRVTPGHVERGLMERLDGAVRGALRGAGVPDAGALADVTRLWPDGRRRRDRARVVAAADLPRRHAAQVAARSSTWAFELGLLADQILAKLAAEIGDGRADRDPLRARAGAGTARAAPRGGGPRRRPRSTTRPGCWPSELTAGMSDDGAARDDRASGRREPRQGRFQPPFLIHCRKPRKARFAGLFSLREVIYAA